MKMRVSCPLSVLFAASIGIIGLQSGARADVVYSQAGNGQACQPSCWTSTLGSDGSGGFRTYDDFQLGTTASINQASWQGFYYDVFNGANNPVQPATVSWTMGFFADNGGVPGAELYTTTLPASQVDTTFLTLGTFGSAVNVYSFTATLPTSFTATTETTYWFSPLSNEVDVNPIFSWSASAAGGGSSEQSTYAGNLTGPAAGATSRFADRAFVLSSVAVPEPGSLALVLGVIPLVLMARRRA